ncbi:MAG: 5-methyltetrahydrofolate--homocysteine methyltransferase [Paracoccaceae bacterium]|jgi:5-methyltetrahydrofolate--homocysteine methyltransferase
MHVPNILNKIIEKQGWLLADGATGTNLFNMGLEAGEAPEIWNDQQPAKIRKLYQDSVDAGSDLFLTNSFGGNASRLKLHNAQNRVLELNRIAADIGRDVADRSDRDIVVAGSMGPTGEIMLPIGTLSHSTAVEMFHEQAEGLKEGGADILWIETLSAREEFLAAAEGIALADMPWAGTMSFDTAGRTMMGLTSVDMAKMVSGIKNKPLAFGANCGVGPSDLLRTLLGFADEDSDIPLISKGNAGIPKYVDGHIHYDGTPELMADYAIMARNIGAKIIGGCCGTMPEHLVAMRAALETSTQGERPTLDQIASTIGAFSSESDGTGDNPGPKPRERRRRRN